MTAATLRFDMHPFGAQLSSWSALLDDVLYLEQFGLGTAWLADHYAWVPTPDAPLLESWSTLAALAAATSRIRLGTLISNVATRHPAILAKQAATVDRISGGRLDLGLGPGYFEQEHRWLDIPFLSPAARVDRLRESVEVIDGLLRHRRLTYEGEYVRVDEAPLVPAPAQEPRPPLIIAGSGPKALAVVAAYADTWVWFADAIPSAEETERNFRERSDLLQQYCDRTGRDPASIERAYLTIGDTESPFASSEAFQDFVGTYREAGVQRFIFPFGDPAGPYGEAVTSGAWAGRGALDAFAAQAMLEMTGTQRRG